MTGYWRTLTTEGYAGENLEYESSQLLVYSFIAELCVSIVSYSWCFKLNILDGRSVGVGDEPDADDTGNGGDEGDGPGRRIEALHLDRPAAELLRELHQLGARLVEPS